MTHPTFDDARLRDACTGRCAVVGDPPCFTLGDAAYKAGMQPCGECLRDVGVEPGDEFDEAAAIARLL